MSDIILHIKDSYYFEVPKVMWKSSRSNVNELPDWLVRLDDDYQSFEADVILEGLKKLGATDSNLEGLKEKWTEWKSSDHVKHTHASWPLDAYLDAEVVLINGRAKKWAVSHAPEARVGIEAYLAENGSQEELAWFHRLVSNPTVNGEWQKVKASVDTREFISSYRASETANWSAEKLAFYNRALDGKVLIPQPFGELKNAYEPASGFCISKYMIIQVLVAIALILALRWLGKKIATGEAPKGRAWNAMESILLLIRDNAIVPVLGHDADRFLPLLWTFFVFIFGLNVAGMIPWMGSPTASLSTASVFALLVFGLGVALGVKTFGVLGFLKNICPELGLPWYFAIWAIPMLWVIEFASLFIKHAVLAIRLLANMVAGHLVLLAFMGLAVGVAVGVGQDALHPVYWWPLALTSALSMTALSVLELFIAFLQAAVFTFLAALFLGSSMHHH